MKTSKLGVMLAGSLLLGMTGTATGQARVDLEAIDREMAGPRAQVLVLGTFHLSEHADEFPRESLEPLLQRLQAFAPDVITVERISGMQCDLVMRYPGVYSVESWKRFCFDTGPARAATGLDVPAATGRMHRMLREWPRAPTPAQRRELASVFLAAGEPESALVQWLRLEEAERHPGDGLDQSLVDLLQQQAEKVSESEMIAVPLAVRLGLERIHPIDDHTGDDGYLADLQAYGAAIQAAWDTRAEAREAVREAGLVALRGGDILEAYRQANHPEVLQVMVESDFGAALSDPSPERYGQFYVGGWETRNLRMVANVREAFRDRPGARVLSIVGAMHKPWFDTMLGQMQGVDIVEVGDVLR